MTNKEAFREMLRITKRTGKTMASARFFVGNTFSFICLHDLVKMGMLQHCVTGKRYYESHYYIFTQKAKDYVETLRSA